MISTKHRQQRLSLKIFLLFLLIIAQTNVLFSQQASAYSENKIIVVDGGNLSGYRQSLVKVDVGFGDRLYWAYTNEYGQLVKIIAKHITLQNDATEPVTSKGRYFPDEAKVPGVESKDLDEGHVIADSLGGVSNAYNITPQESQLNRYGEQAKMEKLIRESGGCTDFIAIITYPNTQTQIPCHYAFTFTINDKTYHKEFDNAYTSNTVNSDNDSLQLNESLCNKNVKIITLDKVNEFIILKNLSDTVIDLKGWIIVSVRGKQSYTFDTYILKPNQEVKIGDSKKSTVDLYWLEGLGIWNNSKSDPAQLYDSNYNLVSVMED
jgi:hypothetical protein